MERERSQRSIIAARLALLAAAASIRITGRSVVRVATVVATAAPRTLILAGCVPRYDFSASLTKMMMNYALGDGRRASVDTCGRNSTSIKLRSSCICCSTGDPMNTNVFISSASLSLCVFTRSHNSIVPLYSLSTSNIYSSFPSAEDKEREKPMASVCTASPPSVKRRIRQCLNRHGDSLYNTYSVSCYLSETCC